MTELYTKTGNVEEREAEAGEADSGKRLDVFLAEKFPDLSRNRIQGLIDEGGVRLLHEGVLSEPEVVTAKSLKLSLNDKIYIMLNERIPLTALPEDIPIDVVYEDADVVVVNKERGMVVHPAQGNYSGTLVNALLGRMALAQSGDDVRPGVVHRIDKNTSGLLVFAKSERALASLAEQFKEHTVRRLYYAVAIGSFREDEGTINAPIAKKPNHRFRRAIMPDGKPAITHWRVLERFSGGGGNNLPFGGEKTLLELRLETGRTHQIRVHMEYIGRPLLGDDLYGSGDGEGQILHAKTLGFVHPASGEYMEFDSELPPYFERVLAKLTN